MRKKNNKLERQVPFVLMCLGSLLVGSSLLTPLEDIAAADSPNILWITSEDHGPEMGCYGDKLAVTPNVDALAKRGMMFKFAWSCAPVCAPARTAIITGMYPPSVGGQHMRSMVQLPKYVQFYPFYLQQAGYYTTNNSKQDYNVFKENQGWNASSRNAHYRNRPDGKPFFTIFNNTVSHESKIRVRPHTAITDAAKVRVPAYHPDNKETRQDWAQYYDIVTQADAIAGKHLAQLDAAGLTDSTIVFYFGDHGSGMSRGKRWTYNSGLSVPVVVYFPEKWKHLAPKEYATGGKSDRLVNFVDLAPTVLSIAGVKPPAHMQGHAFAGNHQQAAPKYMFGFRGRMDERNDFIRTVTDGRYHYIRNYNPHFIYGQYVAYNFVTPSTAAWKRDFDKGILGEPQKQFWGLKPTEELYDLQNDPDEVSNLIGSPAVSKKLKELRTTLNEWCLEIRDVGFLPEGEIHSRSNGTTPYEMGHNDKLYPLKRIMTAANWATSKAFNDLPELKKYIDDDDSAVRYWAAVGILNRGAPAVAVSANELKILMDDASPYAQIAAAYAVAKYSEDSALVQAAVATLLDQAPWTQQQDVFVSIMALNAIDKLDGLFTPSLSRIKAMPTSGGRSPNARYNGYVKGILAKTIADLERG
jgi:arylsulfatase A-like enzyme|tara:strand:- start:1099 stop:3015 length:1917 start_codon:yes stop_codon:yes gene_type:complete